MAIKKSGNTTKANSEIKYEVLEECGVVGKRNGDWEVKLRYMKWNDNEPKYDLRPWKIDEDGNEKSAKGITLSGEELEALGNVITKMMED